MTKKMTSKNSGQLLPLVVKSCSCCMKTSTLFPLIFLSLWFFNLTAQVNFREGWQNNNPVHKDSILSLAEKIKAHQNFLDKSVQQNNTLHQLYGQLYLVYDYFSVQDYVAAQVHLLEAETIANQSDNPGWLGWVIHRKAILALRLNKLEEALQEYEKAAQLCAEAKDSLCLAESLEQVSLMHAKLNDFENAQRVHLIAMPLIEKYGGEMQMGAALTNYGTTNSLQGRVEQSIPYFERAITIYRKLGKHKEEAKVLNNLADGYRRLKRYKDAMEIYQRCLEHNRKHQIFENLVINYSGIQTLASETRDFETAYEYLGLYFLLKDSLSGAEIQRKIAELEIKYESQKKELELEKSKSALRNSQRRLAQQNGIILGVLLLSALGIWRWQVQTKLAKKQLAERQQDLANLTKILLEKNTRILALEEKAEEDLLTVEPTLPTPDIENDLFNQHILTEADWLAFKSAFEKAYPGYLIRLRRAYPGITNAEERLFLFIKLNLGTKESANMLGISATSVKKYRNRLRRRMNLAEEVDLEIFIRTF
jgi:tetratricopeptide (TPR) repeat protein